MAVMFVLLPVALGFAAAALAVFLWAVRTGQFDDLDTPAVRILLDDDGPGADGVPRRSAVVYCCLRADELRAGRRADQDV